MTKPGRTSSFVRRNDPPPGGYSQKNWVGVCGPLPKTLILFMTKICDCPYPIYDLTNNFDTLFIPLVYSCRKHKFVEGFCC